jgi:multidrug efflux pump subunit AcrA (membrane-fusion protein)
MRSESKALESVEVAVCGTMSLYIRIRDGSTEWVNVQTGEQDGKSIEVFGGLREGDEVAMRGTDKLRAGNHVTTKPFAEAAPAK